MSRVLVMGAGGMLGRAFVAALGARAAAVGRAALDPVDARALEALIVGAGASLVVNCAAHTDVDAAERDAAPVIQVNVSLPAAAAAACRSQGAVLVHFSSTGAYGDWKQGAYDEGDPLRPTTVHHRTKAEGEAAVVASGAEHLIVRTGWLFGGLPGQSKNFVWNRLIEARGKAEMTSDAHQRGNPTPVDEVVANTLRAVDAGCRGVVNMVAHGSATRFDYVSRIIAAAGLPCCVRPSDQPFARLAPVSANELAINRKLQMLGLDGMSDWARSVDDYVARLIATPQWKGLSGDVR